MFKLQQQKWYLAKWSQITKYKIWVLAEIIKIISSGIIIQVTNDLWYLQD